MEGNNEEDYLDSLLDSVSVVKDDVVEDELFDGDTNELIGKLNEIMGSSLDDLKEEKTSENSTEDNEAISTQAETNTEEQGASELTDLVMDDELKALLGVEPVEEQKTEGEEGLTPQQEQRLSEMDMEHQEAMDEEQTAETEAADRNPFENDSDWKEDADGLDELPDDIDSYMEGVNKETPKGLKGFFAKLFGKSKNSSKKKKPKKKKEKKQKGKKVQEQEPSTEQESSSDENEKLLNEVFDENGELLDEKKPAKKKSFLVILFNKLNSDDEDDELEVIPEKPKKEKKEKKKKEKPKKAKKPKAQKPKKVKKEKPKKEKKPVRPSELVTVKPVGVIIMLVIIAGVCGFTYFGINAYYYKRQINTATEYLVDGKYDSAFSQIEGVKFKTEDDKLLYEQIATIMFVEKQYQSYINYQKLGMEYEALDSLIKGVAKYYAFREQGNELGVLGDMDSVKAEIVSELEQNYGISEALALTYSEIEDVVQYYYIISSYGGQSK